MNTPIVLDMQEPEFSAAIKEHLDKVATIMSVAIDHGLQYQFSIDRDGGFYVVKYLTVTKTLK